MVGFILIVGLWLGADLISCRLWAIETCLDDLEVGLEGEKRLGSPLLKGRTLTSRTSANTD